MKFSSETECEQVRIWIDSEKQRVRHQKLEQLYELLGIDTTAAQNISNRKSKPLVCEQLKPSPSSDALDVQSIEEVINNSENSNSNPNSNENVSTPSEKSEEIKQEDE